MKTVQEYTKNTRPLLSFLMKSLWLLRELSDVVSTGSRIINLYVRKAAVQSKDIGSHIICLVTDSQEEVLACVQIYSTDVLIYLFIQFILFYLFIYSYIYLCMNVLIFYLCIYLFIFFSSFPMNIPLFAKCGYTFFLNSINSYYFFFHIFLFDS